MNKIKVVRWQGRVNPVYEELGEIEIFETKIGWYSEEEELCIDIDDILEWVKYRT